MNHINIKPTVLLAIAGCLIFFLGLSFLGLSKEPEAIVQRPQLTMSATQFISMTETPTLAPTITHSPTATATPISTPSATRFVLPTPLPEQFFNETATAEAAQLIVLEAPAVSSATPLPLPTLEGTISWTVKVPILMYHYISVPPEDADIYRDDLSVTPENFAAQMNYLAENGFTPIDFYQLTLAIAGKGSLPELPVIISFDDGYIDNYEYAFPILQQHQFKATFFIATEFVDLQNPNYMNWEMIEEMAEAGMSIEAHSKNHHDLRDRDDSFLIWEILGSQETIAAHTGKKPHYFAYPGGRYDEDTIRILAELQFWGAVTTQYGKWHGFEDRFEWSRVRMRNSTTVPVFADYVH